MATQYKTPGVYIQEPSSFPPSIVGVDTAVPCFIGYTEKARDRDGRDLNLTPKRIESMAEFVQYFGSDYSEQFYLLPAPPPASGSGTAAAGAAAAATATAGSGGGTSGAAAPATTVPATDYDWGVITLDGKNFYKLVEAGNASFYLFNSMRLFYANGGGSCYVISCGTYGGRADATVGSTPINDALEVSKTFIGPTMLAVPDAVLLTEIEYNAVVAKMLAVCQQTGDRMALIDLWGMKGLSPRDDWSDQVDRFRAAVASQTKPEMLRFGAAYFPPLVTSIVAADEIDISNFSRDADKIATLKGALGAILLANFPSASAPDAAVKPADGSGGGETTGAGTADAAKGKVKTDPTAAGGGGGTAGGAGGTASEATVTAERLSAKGALILNNYVDLIGAPDAKLTDQQLTQGLVAAVPGFKQLLSAIAATQGVLPPSGAMAGVWTSNDVTRGVWNAPANTGIATMVRPLLPVNDQQQEDLNVPVQGLAVNAIRTFQGRGSLIWGARTLDSLSNDWRYIQVRRTMIYVEQSVKQALEAMVFRPNTAQTWVTVTSMIESFLHGLWSSGGLMGDSPGDAYKVLAGLGSTMTPDDVLNGVMRVQITLQMVHPVEFIELTFKQQMLGGA